MRPGGEQRGAGTAAAAPAHGAAAGSAMGPADDGSGSGLGRWVRQPERAEPLPGRAPRMGNVPGTAPAPQNASGLSFTCVS